MEFLVGFGEAYGTFGKLPDMVTQCMKCRHGSGEDSGKVRGPREASEGKCSGWQVVLPEGS